MAQMIGGVGVSHIPALVPYQDQDRENEGEYAPFFEGARPVRDWVRENRPDTAIVIYNDHGLSFFLDAMPTFALGAAPGYVCGDEGWGARPLPPVPGHQDLSWHIIDTLIEDEFDPTICQELVLDHGASMPIRLLWKPEPDWDIKIVPVAVNVIQHPIPKAKRCHDLGKAIRRAVDSFPGDEKVMMLGTGGLSHQLSGERAGFNNPEFDQSFMDRLANDPEALTRLSSGDIMREAGAEGVEVVMWLTMRGALDENVNELYRNYYSPVSVTASGLQLLVNA